MKHAILGIGGVGGLIGTALGSLGEDISVIVRPGSLSDYPKELSLERPTGTITCPARAVARLTEAVDVLWIATKTFHLQASLELVESAPRMVVPLLNGVDHVSVLRARFGHDAVVPATISVEAERLAPGRFIQRSPFVRLAIASSGEAALGALVERLREIGFTCLFIANEKTLLWSKLCFLGPYAMVTSASGKNTGEISADAEWKRKLDTAIAEACAVAKADGAEVDVPKLLAFCATMPPTMRSSMQKDVAAKRPLELDSIGGPIARLGEHYAVDVPVTRALIAAINAMTAAHSG